MKNRKGIILTARSGTSEEARLRTDEAALILQWVERAKKIEPSGQVLIAQAPARNDLLLENGDIIRVPPKDGLVLVSGEVLFPNTIAFDASRIVIAHRDGSFADGDGAIRTGDEIMVLPRIDVKSRQILKELTLIIYQIAVSAKIVLRSMTVVFGL